MQGNSQNLRSGRGVACTAWLLVGAVAPFGGLVARPLALVGAIVVVFAFVIAAIEVRH